MDAIKLGPETITINSPDGRLILRGHEETFCFGADSRVEEIIAAERLYNSILTIQEFVQKKWGDHGIIAKDIMVPFVIECAPIRHEIVDGLKRDQVDFKLRLYNGEFITYKSLNLFNPQPIAYEYMHRVVQSWLLPKLTDRAQAVQESVTDILFIAFRYMQADIENWHIEDPIRPLTLSRVITWEDKAREGGKVFFERHCLGHGFYRVVKKIRDWNVVLKIWWTAFKNYKNNNFIQQTLLAAGEERGYVSESWNGPLSLKDLCLSDVILKD